MNGRFVLLFGGLLVLYAVCSVLSYALLFAHFQRQFPEIAERDRATDRLSCSIFGLLPTSLIAALIFLAVINGPRDMFKYGLKF